MEEGKLSSFCRAAMQRAIDTGLLDAQSEFVIGDRVITEEGDVCIVRYVGKVYMPANYRVSNNLRIGVELQDPFVEAEDDGAGGCVGGIKYFHCEPGRGLFRHASQLRRYCQLLDLPPELLERIAGVMTLQAGGRFAQSSGACRAAARAL